MPSEIRPEYLKRGDKIPASWLNQLVDALVQRITVRGGRATRTGSGIAISIDDPRAFGQPRWFKITSVRPHGLSRCEYSASEVRPDDGGTFSAITSGLTVTNLYNSIEANNTGTGVEGHGVDVDGADYPGGFSVKPIATNAVVLAWPVQSGNETEAIQWMTMVVNADDGTC